MKNSIIIFCALFLGFAACKNNPSQNENKAQDSGQSVSGMETMYACPMHPEITGKQGDKCSKCGMELTEVKGMNTSTTANTAINNNQAAGTTSVKAILDGYLLLKNDLTADKTQDAAAAGKALEAAIKGFDKNALTTEQKKVYDEVEDDAREHAEHIGSNGGNIEHQREHFALLSKDVYDLVKAVGSFGQPLYQDFCPMYDNKKGAIWLSETKEIANPYYGKKMLTCGQVKDEIK